MASTVSMILEKDSLALATIEFEKLKKTENPHNRAFETYSKVV